jgi:enamine deaminase RidA (YjgF/YER057c/UK114 family)
MTGRIEQRMAEHGIVLPPAMRAMANYVPYTVTGKHVWVAGQGPFLDGKLHYNGRLGANLTVEDGRACARIVGLNILAQLNAA